MRDILPSTVIDIMRDRYLAGVADAEAGFKNARGDEDSLTGALGQAISSRRPMAITVDGTQYLVKFRWDKLRGRGLNAPERLYGPDGIFQIEVMDGRGEVTFTKGLPFQAKTDWKGKNSSLARQAASMEVSQLGGIIVNYTDSGYEACTTRAAVEHKGKYGMVKQAGEIQPLGQILANEFIDCTRGSVGLFFDYDTERFIGSDGLVIRPMDAITTSIEVTRIDR